MGLLKIWREDMEMIILFKSAHDFVVDLLIGFILGIIYHYCFIYNNLWKNEVIHSILLFWDALVKHGVFNLLWDRKFKHSASN